MKITTMGGFDWLALKEIGDKTLLFSKDILFKGYFDGLSNVYEQSKLNSFLNDRFIEILKENGFDESHVVNGIWPLTTGQYNIYVKEKTENMSDPWFLRTPGKEKKILAVSSTGEVYEEDIINSCGIRPAMMVDTEYVTSFTSETIESPHQTISEEDDSILELVKSGISEEILSQINDVKQAQKETENSIPDILSQPISSTDSVIFKDVSGKATDIIVSEDVSVETTEQTLTQNFSSEGNNNLLYNTEEAKLNNSSTIPPIEDGKERFVNASSLTTPDKIQKSNKEIASNTQKQQDIMIAKKIIEQIKSSSTLIAPPKQKSAETDISVGSDATFIETIDSKDSTHAHDKPSNESIAHVTTNKKTININITDTTNGETTNVENTFIFDNGDSTPNEVDDNNDIANEIAAAEYSDEAKFIDPLPEITIPVDGFPDSNIDDFLKGIGTELPTKTDVPIPSQNPAEPHNDSTTFVTSIQSTIIAEPTTPLPVVIEKPVKKNNNSTYLENNKKIRKSQNSIFSKLGKNVEMEEEAPHNDSVMSAQMAEIVEYYNKFTPKPLTQGSQSPSAPSLRESELEMLLAAATEENAELKEAIKKNNRLIIQMKTIIIEERTKSEELMNEVNKLITIKNKGYENKIHAYENAIKEYRSQIVTSQKKIKELESTATSLKDKLHTPPISCSSVDKKIPTEKDEEIDALKRTLETYKNFVKELTK